VVDWTGCDMVDGDGIEDPSDGADRLLVRPYIQRPVRDSDPDPADPPVADRYHLPESGDSSAESDDTLVSVASAVADDPASPASDIDGEPTTAVRPTTPAEPDPDRRQMAWLVGAGLALLAAVVMTMVALWPGADEESTSAAGPPGGLTAPRGADPSASAAPSPSAASPSASAGSPSPGRTPSSTPPASGPATTPPASVPPSATLAPPPAADRVGPITGAGGDCLDVSAGIALPGSPLAVRDCNGTMSQRWTVATDGTLRVGGLCAAADGSGAVAVSGCGDTAAAQWRAGAGSALVHVGSGRCLTAPADGGRVRVSPCGGTGQSWALP
jgi:hypothetical protein